MIHLALHSKAATACLNLWLADWQSVFVTVGTTLQAAAFAPKLDPIVVCYYHDNQVRYQMVDWKEIIDKVVCS